jgi:hypothetical protein
MGTRHRGLGRRSRDLSTGIGAPTRAARPTKIVHLFSGNRPAILIPSRMPAHGSLSLDPRPAMMPDASSACRCSRSLALERMIL